MWILTQLCIMFVFVYEHFATNASPSPPVHLQYVSLTLWSEALITPSHLQTKIFFSMLFLVTNVCFVFFGHQLITAFEKTMVLMDPIPGEEHKKVSTDYVKCLSKVSVPTLI